MRGLSAMSVHSISRPILDPRMMRPLPLAACLALITAFSVHAFAQEAEPAPAEAVVPAEEAAPAPVEAVAPAPVETVAPTPAALVGDPAAGRQLAYTCHGCHGVTGYKNAYPNFKVPMIGGQSFEYLAQALHEYRDGQRKHPTMQAQAESFSDQDITDIATFLSTLK